MHFVPQSPLSHSPKTHGAPNMPEVKLSPRLETVLSMVPFGTRLADVGSDHGRLAAAACQRGSTPRAVAIDTSEKAVQLIRRTAYYHGVQSQVEARLGNGVAPLGPREVETVVIAGMGADRMASILSPGASRIESLGALVLSPNRGVHVLRSWLREAGWRLEDERAVHDDGRFYVIMRAVPGDAEATYRGALNTLFGRADALQEPGYFSMARAAASGLDRLGPIAVKRSDPVFRDMWHEASARLRSAALHTTASCDAPSSHSPQVITKAMVLEAALILTKEYEPAAPIRASTR